MTEKLSIQTHRVGSGIKPLRNIKNIIAVGSGKGGVGKSTVAVNLALALARQGAEVGLLDADIYGPSQPQMLGIQGASAAVSDLPGAKKLEPMMAHGLQSMSIGYLIDTSQAVVWRGPMVSKALQQLLFDTHWQNLDYLIIDLPPGTGDVQLTMAQKIPVTAAIIVTTPQDIALLDARKAMVMFEKVSIPVLGIIENMSYYHCASCDKKDYIFGQGGGEKIANEFATDLLGQVPLATQIQRETDSGKPTVVAEPDSDIAACFSDIACHTAAKIAKLGKDYSGKFPDIVVE